MIRSDHNVRIAKLIKGTFAVGAMILDAFQCSLCFIIEMPVHLSIMVEGALQATYLSSSWNHSLIMTESGI